MLSKCEMETIINFNKEEKIAYIFTYEKTWQRHLEKKLGLKSIFENSFGGKEYEIDKKRIKMPRALRKVKMTPKQKKAMAEGRTKSILSRKSIAI